jgi:hypothetical protein
MSRYLKPKVKVRLSNLKSNGRFLQEIPEEAILNKRMMRMMRMKCQMILHITICLKRKVRK